MQITQPEEALIDRERVRRRGFYEFVKLAWPIVESAQFVDNWHIGAKCEFLEACQRREIRKGIINEPPGFSKSLMVSVFYPSWVWTLDGSERFMCASYDASLSERDARRHRDLVSSTWYSERWPVRIPANSVKQVRNFTNDKGGFRFSTSIGGKATGRHAHQRIIDDPIKPKDTMGGAELTRKRLQACVDFYRGTWTTRTADPSKIIDLIIMQRLHDSDLVGVLLAEGGWEHLMLPMRYEPKRTSVVLGRNVDPRKDWGELLCPERFPEAAVVQLETDLGKFAEPQLQQNPTPEGGGTFKRDWIRYWSPDGKIPGTVALPVCPIQIQSWDAAFKGTNDSDFVVGQCWGRAYLEKLVAFFLLDQVRGQWAFGETCDRIVAFSTLHPRAITKLVEDKANGPAIIDSLTESIPGIEPVNPEGGKEARANAIAGLWGRTERTADGGKREIPGVVFLPHPSLAPWVKDFETELVRFPKAPNDDQVDCMSQALLRLYTTVPKLVEAMKALKNNPSMLGALAGRRS